MNATAESGDVLRFWFPDDSAEAPSESQLAWWFGGGSDAGILARFTPLLERAIRGELDDWSRTAASRLALILVLDQFSRSVHRASARAFAQDARALALALEGIDAGHYAQLAAPWQKIFFMMPLAHSEDLALQERCVQLSDELVASARPAQRDLLVHSASQARAHRDVVARFGRHPHRNEVLGRVSTREERAYIERGEFPHTHPRPRGES